MKFKLISNKSFINSSCLLFAFIFGMALNMSGPVLIEISRKTGVGIEDAGSIFSLLYGGVIAGSLINGFFVKHSNRKTVILIFYLMLALSVLAFPFTFGALSLAAVVFIIGLSSGFAHAQTNSLVMDINKVREGLFVSLLTVAFGIGAIISPLLLGLLMNNGIGWQVSYFIVALLGIINFIFFIFADLSFLKPPEKYEDFIFFKKTKNNNFVVFIILAFQMFLYICIESSFIVWLPTFLRTVKDFSIGSASLVLSLFWIFLTAGRLIFGIISGKQKNTYHIIVAGVILSIFSLISGISINNTAVVMGSFALFGFFISGVWPMIITFAGLKYPSIRNQIVSVLIIIDGTGGLFSPWLLGKIFKATDLSVAIKVEYIFLALLLAFVLMLLFFEKKYKFVFKHGD